MLARLTHSNARAAAAIARGAGARHAPIEKTTIDPIGRYFSQTKLSAKNTDTLLEVTTAFAIARAAVRAGWELSARHLDERGANKYTYPQLTLKQPESGLGCTVSKTRPEGLNLREPLAEAMGLTSNGGQPDVVVTFAVSANARHVSFLCDAKRNNLGTGIPYLAASLDRMLAYIVEYARPLGFTLDGDAEKNDLYADAPLATIFAWQGVNKIAGRPGDGVAETLDSPITRVPIVMAFDRSHMAAPDDPAEAWVLKSWFKRLARVAEKTLA
jgi:hypothetical protein